MNDSAILKKADFEKEIKEVIEKATKLYASVKVETQWFDGLCTSTIVLNVEIPINGYLEDVPFANSPKACESQ